MYTQSFTQHILSAYFLPDIGLSIMIMTMKPVDSFFSARSLSLVEDAEKEIGIYIVC